ncbi:MAG: hypothetical protein P1V20_29790, partial [Verrucomicrobiales bacterium]|nr:hypothetical protein [Verrucomicrobiales bacterium]
TFGTNNHRMAESLSGLLGKKYSPHELLTLPQDQQLILTPKGIVQQVRKLDYLEDPLFKGKFDPNPLYRAADNSESVMTLNEDDDHPEQEVIR